MASRVSNSESQETPRDDYSTSDDSMNSEDEEGGSPTQAPEPPTDPRGGAPVPKISLSMPQPPAARANAPSIPSLGLQGLKTSSDPPKPTPPLKLPLGVPALNTAAVAPSRGDDNPRPMMPKLSLGYGAPAASPAEGAGGDAAGQSVVVDMVSSAFQLANRVATVNGSVQVVVPTPLPEDSAAAGRAVMDSVSARCSTGLGIVPEDIQYFELRTLRPEEAALAVANGSHIGFRVKRSGLTLAAMEQLLEEHARSVANLEKCTAALEGIREEANMQSTAAASAQSALAAEEARSRDLVASNEALEGEVGALRQQLARADQLRLQSQQSLDQLKAEFDALTKEMASQMVTLPAPAPAPAAGASGRRGATARALDALERICSDDMAVKLEKLEEILQMVPNK